MSYEDKMMHRGGRVGPPRGCDVDLYMTMRFVAGGVDMTWTEPTRTQNAEQACMMESARLRLLMRLETEHPGGVVTDMKAETRLALWERGIAVRG